MKKMSQASELDAMGAAATPPAPDDGASPMPPEPAAEPPARAGPLETAPAPDDPDVSLAMLNGNFATAVEVCLAQGRVADALILAASGGEELWAATHAKYAKAGLGAIIGAMNSGRRGGVAVAPVSAA